ncbi:RagB/SusD family nutrient uptake outer membrane protein [Paradesertivirga mongoliensis]|uniref:RagB/SusD family nutrient uptake outer membrane protein n=1 Tax=Paradesertivirga mongoliensis TaxID=2100740 RepID=A0ABW4ZSW1_9SPHI|nr:RagB/SusD family nutrient uptake outer membrane protein [Pedobacter mongoliensis]
MNTVYNRGNKLCLTKSLSAVLFGWLLLGSCKKEFLEPQPLSFYEPGTTFTTESGLQAALATSDRHLRNYWTIGANISTPIMTEYTFSELAVNGKTDQAFLDDVNIKLTPTGGAADNDDNRISYFWNEGYSGIKYANTVIAYADKVQGLAEGTKNAYLGRAYFHRSYRYLSLVFQFGDIPFVTQLLQVPKQNYRSTKKEAILKKITEDMEFAVQWVPDQANTTYVGQVNKGACRQLLIKCYLATGQFQKAKDQADILINQSGYQLMQNNFGTFNPGGESQTWTITRNVIWDLHRPENKLIAANKEVIMGLPNRGSSESFTNFLSMRIFGPFWNSGEVKTPDGRTAVNNYARNNGNYNKSYDYVRAIGRGIATIRPTYFAQNAMWGINGVMDQGDLRHNSAVGNWVTMTSLKYNDKASSYFGQNLRLRHPVTNNLLSGDTVRTWFDFPHYKIFLNDVVAEANQGANQFNGATLGSNADWYLYRLAETYLLRAEAKFYLGDATAVADVNAVRSRAQCTQLYTTVTIGDIMDERARELYLEEWRHTELSRVSYCLALSGKPDEWGNTYNVDTYDKQSGTGLTGGSYWYQRIVRYNNNGFYNNGKEIKVGSRTYNFTMGKQNLYWPIPNGAIRANNKGQLSQNFGYDGYDVNTPKWSTWEEAVGDESKTE